MRDEAYDEMNLKCYKYGYFEGRLKNIKSKKDKYEFYKKMRFLYQGVKFQDDPPTLLRINIDRNPYKNLSLILDKMVKETGISEHELKDIYKTFRELEIQRNYDNNKDEKWIETKDIINQELSV